MSRKYLHNLYHLRQTRIILIIKAKWWRYPLRSGGTISTTENIPPPEESQIHAQLQKGGDSRDGGETLKMNSKKDTCEVLGYDSVTSMKYSALRCSRGRQQRDFLSMLPRSIVGNKWLSLCCPAT